MKLFGGGFVLYWGIVGCELVVGRNEPDCGYIIC